MIDPAQGLFCGDCLEFMGALEGKSIDLIVTDPPYEITDMTVYFREFTRLLKDTGSVYIFGDKNRVAESWFSQLQIPCKELLVWYYKNSPKPKGRWRMSMQPVIYGYFSNMSVFHEDEARVEYMPATKKLHGRIRPSSGRMDACSAYDTSKGALPRDVIEHPALLGHLSRERVGHPDQKPLGLIEKLVRVSSNPGDVVLDPFAGTGTTVFACINSGRQYYACEQSPTWYDFILEEINKIEPVCP
jgi:site-specific DNA-methyltransferase (adenine-specific)